MKMDRAIYQCGLMIFVIVGSCTSSHDYFERSCLKEEHFSAIADHAFLHNISTIRPNFTCANVTLPNVSTTYSSLMMQYHVWDSNISASLYDSYNPQYSMSGDHFGLVYAMSTDPTDTLLTYVTLANKNQSTTEALIMYTALNTSQPVPGACNMENNLKYDPNLMVEYQVKNVLINVTFAPANIGFEPMKQPECQDPVPNQLRYDFYIRFIPWLSHSKKSLFEELRKMMTVDGMKANGRLIHQFGKNDLPEVGMALFNGRGMVLNLVVRNALTGAEAAYVPTVTYACGDNVGSMCTGRIQPVVAVIFALGMIVGGLICFCGHYYYHAEFFFFGFLPFCLLSYMILAANTSLSLVVMLVLALVFGIPGGLIWVALWWRFGYVFPIMLWISFCLGLMLSSLIYFTPFGNLNVWYNDLAYGMAFMCGVMLVPVILIIFTKFLSMLACAVWGAYLIVAAISYYSGGVMHYILLNIIHRASIPRYSEAYFIVPMEPLDYVLIGVWFVLIVAGVLNQKRIYKGRQDFPLCGYKENLLKRNRAKARQNRFDDDDTPQFLRRPEDRTGPCQELGAPTDVETNAAPNAATNVEMETNDDSDRAPLIIN